MTELDGIAAIVAVPHAGLDDVYAALGDAPVDLLCDPIEGDLTAAIALSLQAAQSTLLHDIGRESESLRLQQLSEAVSCIARTPANLSSQDDSPALPLSASASRAETHGGYAVEIGRAPWRASVCQYVERSVGAVSLNNNK